MLKVHIRWMIRRDHPEVLAIEEASFTQNVWSEEDFLTCLRQRNCIGMVAEAGETIVGYQIYTLHKQRFEVLNWAVDPKSRRQGVGAQMHRKLASKLSHHRRRRIDVTVRETNLPALCFWRAMGFKGHSITRGFYEDTGEDAIHLTHWLDEPETAVPCNRVAKLPKEQP